MIYLGLLINSVAYEITICNVIRSKFFKIRWRIRWKIKMIWSWRIVKIGNDELNSPTIIGKCRTNYDEIGQQYNHEFVITNLIGQPILVDVGQTATNSNQIGQRRPNWFEFVAVCPHL